MPLIYIMSDLFKFGWLVFFLCHHVTATAEKISVPIKMVHWKIDRSRTLCSIQQDIADFGQAGFYQFAGERLIFSFKEYHSDSGISRASLFVEPAPWRNDLTYKQDYQVFQEEAVSDNDRGRLSVYGENAEAMLQALLNGHYPVLEYIRQKQRFRVEISSINFSKAYQQFSDCRNQLLPFGIKQLQQGSLFFSQNSKVLNAQVKTRLRHVARLLKEIKPLKVILVSATAGVGKMDKKWFGQRSKLIRDGLIKLGVDTQRIMIKSGRYSQRNDNELVLKVFGPDALRFYYYRKGNIGLSAREKQRLDLLARYIQTYFVSGKIMISSHTDSKGSRASNLNVSRKRGEVIRQYLVQKGIDADRIQVKAYGESRPVRSNRFPPGRAQNRRVIVSLI